MADPNIATPVIVPGLRGGTTGQVHKKSSNTDFDYGWGTLAAVATSGAYADITGTPSLGTASTHAATDFQTADSDLTTIAALDSTTAGVIASTGSGWLNRTYGQIKTSLALVIADISGLASALYTETVEVIGNSGSSKTLNGPASGTMKTVTMTANCTFTMPTATAGQSFCIEETQGGAGSFVPTYTGVRWTGGTMPASSTAIGAIDTRAFVCIDGAHWEGYLTAKGLA